LLTHSPYSFLGKESFHIDFKTKIVSRWSQKRARETTADWYQKYVNGNRCQLIEQKSQMSRSCCVLPSTIEWFLQQFIHRWFGGGEGGQHLTSSSDRSQPLTEPMPQGQLLGHHDINHFRQPTVLILRTRGEKKYNFSNPF
jgi:hypothetical protein